MIGVQLNIFDFTVIGIMLLSGIFACFRGFVREILSLGAWIGAAIITLYYFSNVAEKLQPYFKSPVVAAGVGTLGIYILALIGFSLINWFILKFFKEGSDVGILDNMLGLLFGIFRGAFIISLGFFMVTLSVSKDQYPDWIKQAITRPYVEKGALTLAKMAPNYLREISSLKKEATENMEAESPAAGDTKTGYSKNSARQLDRLIESTGSDK